MIWAGCSYTLILPYWGCLPLSLMEWKREEGKGAEGRGRKKRNKRHDKTMNKAKQSCVYLKLYTKLIIPSAFLKRLT